MKVAILVPTHELAPATFMYDLAQLSIFTAATMPEGWDLGLYMVSGTYIHDARQQLAVASQEADYVLWLDSDMRFPRDTLARLMAHKKDVVGINYAKRGIPSGYVAIKEVGIPGKVLETREDSTGLEEVEAMGFGCVLMRNAVLQKLPPPMEDPWFQHQYLGNGIWLGEDVYFCKLLRESAGVTLYVDHDLSRDCGHTGQFTYECRHAEMSTGATV
jgi:hypothetical protein